MKRERPEAPAGRGIEAGRSRHVPVLLAEVIEQLDPKNSEMIIDGTFGAGGFSRGLLEKADCRVLALDRDPSAIAAGRTLVAEFAPRLLLVEGNFGELDEVAGQHALAAVEGVVLDIGVSSMQIDDPGRGFSFMNDGPLDMRMGASGPTAADFLNSADEEDIANVIYFYGEERRSRAIARAIVARRLNTPYTRTSELAETVSRILHGRKIDGRHPATRTFQALRIYINDELGELLRGLSAAEKILRPGGRLVVVTFHSLEDRIVKRFMASRAGKEPGVSRHIPMQSIKSEPESFQILNSRPLTPSQGELDLNPRARSARLRAAIRTSGPSRPLDPEALGLPSLPGKRA